MKTHAQQGRVLVLLSAMLVNACGGGVAVVGGDASAGALDAVIPGDFVTSVDAVLDASVAIDREDPERDVIARMDAPVDAQNPELDAPIAHDGATLDAAEVSDGAADSTQSVCAELCAAGASCCGSRCVDLRSDPAHCGACDNRCPELTACVSGRCVCPPGQLLCGGACAPLACAAGRGVCARSGVQRCVDGGLLCTATPGTPGLFEVCNNLDDDCDGLVDEELVRPCFTSGGAANVGLCRAGSQSCLEGQWGTCAGEVGPRPELCNGQDDDCDGITDNLAQQACFSGGPSARNRGRCRDGAVQCVGARAQCVGEVLPIPEVCNGQDDDCDGTADDSPSLLSCPSRPNSTPSGCSGGQCTYACTPGFASCDGSGTNGCETNLSADPTRCGSCTNACAAGSFCDNGACRASCTGTSCGGQCVNTATSTAHCGACGRACSAPTGGTTACMGGTCVAVCPAGTVACGNACVDLTRDPAHCGACGIACGTGQSCNNDLGVPLCECAGSSVRCGGVCRDTLSDPQNCGGCGVQCGFGQLCQGGACRCTATGTALCNGACVNLGGSCSVGVGQCARTGSLVCGTSGPICDVIPGTPLTELCNNLDDDCDGIIDNNNAANSCTLLPFQSATCTAGTCGRSCLPDRGDCDGMLANGCESDLTIDPRHCGRCDNACNAGEGCFIGLCGGFSTDAGLPLDGGGDTLRDAPRFE